MRLVRVGSSAVLAEVEGVRQAAALYREARRRGVRARDIVPAATTVLFDGVPDVDALEAELGRLPVADQAPPTSGPVEVPTTYDGPDLDRVARRWQMTTREVVATHTATEFVVAFCGFSPGFAYCTGLPDHLHVPRLDSPRTRVPAGSVGVAGGFTGVYPSASPGGWQLLGRTSLTLWDPGREEPATLPPGTGVRFTQR